MRSQAVVLRQRTDGRQMITHQWDAQDWRLPAWGIGAHPSRKQVEARFIYPDDRLLLLGSLFVRSGQRSSHQAAMTASSRWAARTIGF
jgi:hypothetical protein